MAEKLKSIVKRATISADAAEEFEDDAGNVYSKKTYEGEQVYALDYLLILKLWANPVEFLLQSM